MHHRCCESFPFTLISYSVDIHIANIITSIETVLMSTLIHPISIDKRLTALSSAANLIV